MAKKQMITTTSLALLLVCSAALADAGPDGGAIYKTNCAICHGVDGKGQTPVGRSLKVKDLGSAEVQKLSNAEMQKVIADGKGTMPAFKDKLDQARIDALIAFIRTLKK
ncbi:MAG TPA: cytochrome c [Thermoanaerobaculia bacterium]|nr:cytochrome c [Thermoanaerobaculia bacterium]